MQDIPEVEGVGLKVATRPDVQKAPKATLSAAKIEEELRSTGAEEALQHLAGVKPEDATVKRDEPIGRETIDGVCNLMRDVPRLGDVYAFEVPYRVERQMPVDGILDEETGLYVEAAFNPGPDKFSRLRPTRGLTVVLSTPALKDQENASANLDQMVDALTKIYGESPDLEEKIKYIRKDVSDSNSVYDRVKFELFSDEGGPVLNGFSATRGKERVPIKWWEKSPGRPVSESGGLFLKGILERTIQKQVDEAKENRLLTELAIEKVKDEVIPNDDSTVYEYAYHATNRSNIPSINELGLLPSGSKSKEPGTIFFTSWDSATVAHPNGEKGEGVLYRFHIQDMPEIAKSWGFDKKEGLRGIGISYPTDKDIPSDILDFSLDEGKTWMPTIPRMKQAA